MGNSEVKSSNVHEFFKSKEVVLEIAEDFDLFSTDSGVTYDDTQVTPGGADATGSGSAPTGSGASDPGGGAGFTTDLSNTPSGSGSTPVWGGQHIKQHIGSHVRVKCSTRFHPSVSSGTATLENAGSGSPGWANTTQVANGVFKIPKDDFINGMNDLRMKVESSSPGGSADVSYSNVQRINVFRPSHVQICRTGQSSVDDNAAYNCFINFNSAMYFVAKNSSGVNKIFKMNTSEVVTQISNIGNDQGQNDVTNIDTSSPWNAVVFNGELYFVHPNYNIYKITTSDTIVKVTNFGSERAQNNLWSPFVFNNKLWFIGDSDGSGTAFKLYSIDTSGNVVKETNFNSVGSDFSTGVWVPIIFDSKLWFVAADSGGFFKLFNINTSGTVTKVTDINSGAQDFSNHDYWSPILFNSKLYFQPLNVGGTVTCLASVTTGLTITKITDDSLTMFSQSYAGPFHQIVFNGYLYFSLSDGFAYYIAKCSTSDVLTRITSGDQDTALYSPMLFNSKIYYSGVSEGGYNAASKMFSINTSDVVTQVSDLFGDSGKSETLGQNGFGHYTMAVIGSNLYFSAYSLSGYQPGAAANGRMYKIDSSDTLSVATCLGSDSIYARAENANAEIPQSGTPIHSFNSNIYFYGSNKSQAKRLFRL